MKGSDKSRGEKLFFLFAAAGIAVVVFAGDLLASENLLLPVVGIVSVVFLSFFAWQIAKEWKKTDEEVLDMDQGWKNGKFRNSQKKPVSYEDRRSLFFGSIVFVAFILFRDKQIDPGTLIFCGIALLAGCVWFLPAWIQKRRGKEGQPLFPKAKLQPEQLFYMLFSLVGTCFIGFWIYLILSNVPQMWWFSIPGFVIGAGVSRPLVAGLRILLRRDQDPGEKHINKREDKDPWDKLDRGL